MTEKSQEVINAVTEEKLRSHATAIENNQELTAKLVDRLDNHITASIARDERIQENLSDVTIAVTKLSTVVTEATETIKEILPIVQDSRMTIIEWKAVRKTIVTIATVVSLLIGGAWAVFNFYVDHNTDILNRATDTK